MLPHPEAGVVGVDDQLEGGVSEEGHGVGANIPGAVRISARAGVVAGADTRIFGMATAGY